jgi:hypothetical protein
MIRPRAGGGHLREGRLRSVTARLPDLSVAYPILCQVGSRASVTRHSDCALKIVRTSNWEHPLKVTAARTLRHREPSNEPPFSGERPSKARERVRCNGMLGLRRFTAGLRTGRTFGALKL